MDRIEHTQLNCGCNNTISIAETNERLKDLRDHQLKMMKEVRNTLLVPSQFQQYFETHQETTGNIYRNRMHNTTVITAVNRLEAMEWCENYNVEPF